jgi:hypothetical protein
MLRSEVRELQTSTPTNAPDLVTQLKELQTAIATEPHLPEPDKAETLQKVEDIAKAATHPSDKRRQGAAKAAIGFLKGTIETIPQATGFIEACTKLLPLITKAIGLPL